MVLIDVIKIQNLPFLLVAPAIYTCIGKYTIMLLFFLCIFFISQDKKQLLLSIISGKILIFRFAMFNKPPTTAQDKLYYSSQLLDPHFHTTKISTRSHSIRPIQNAFIPVFLFEFYKISMTCIIISPFKEKIEVK